METYLGKYTTTRFIFLIWYFFWCNMSPVEYSGSCLPILELFVISGAGDAAVISFWGNLQAHVDPAERNKWSNRNLRNKDHRRPERVNLLLSLRTAPSGEPLQRPGRAGHRSRHDSTAGNPDPVPAWP